MSYTTVAWCCSVILEQHFDYVVFGSGIDFVMFMHKEFKV